jgi:hypothetical protein
VAIISISITESDLQIISGIPRYVVLETNIPATIFYTLDNSEPNTNSSIYLDNQLILPTDENAVNLKIYATNGVDNSAIISRFYRTDILAVRMSRDTATSDNYSDSVAWGDFGPASLIVDSPDIAGISDGYDWTGAPSTAETDRPLIELDILYSTTNSKGETGHGIGTLPSEITYPYRQAPPQSSETDSRFFNSKALVIYQDSRLVPYDPNMINLNRANFSLGNPEDDGQAFLATGWEGLSTTGSFLRAHYNKTENTTTYYYLDSKSLRWIISKEPAVAPPNFSTIYPSSRQKGVGKVFKWIPFKGSRLI